MKKKVNPIEKLSLNECLKRLEICQKRIEKLKKFYKRKDDLLKVTLPKVFDKGKYNEDTESFSIKANGKLYTFSPSYNNAKGEFLPTVYRAVGIETYPMTVESIKKGDKQKRK